MKKFILIALLVFTTQIKAQTNKYHPFPDSNAVWCVSICGAYSQTLTGDTIVSGITYHKLFQSGIYYPIGGSGGCENAANGGTASFSAGYLGAIRQDTIQRKVYFLFHSSTRDTLLCDFTLAVGDTVKTFNTRGYPGCVVTSIDSVLIGTSYRKRWNVHIPTPCPDLITEQIIEGIGCTSGLFDQKEIYGLCDMYGNLYCFSQNNQTLYPTYNATAGCSQILEGIEQYNTNNTTISAYPNRASTVLNVTLLHFDKLNVQDANATIQITDVFGNIVKQLSIVNSGLTIDVADLSNGVYFLNLKTTQGLITQKLVVQH